VSRSCQFQIIVEGKGNLRRHAAGGIEGHQWCARQGVEVGFQRLRGPRLRSARRESIGRFAQSRLQRVRKSVGSPGPTKRVCEIIVSGFGRCLHLRPSGWGRLPCARGNARRPYIVETVVDEITESQRAAP